MPIHPNPNPTAAQSARKFFFGVTMLLRSLSSDCSGSPSISPEGPLRFAFCDFRRLSPRSPASRRFYQADAGGVNRISMDKIKVSQSHKKNLGLPECVTKGASPRSGATRQCRRHPRGMGSFGEPCFVPWTVTVFPLEVQHEDARAWEERPYAACPSQHQKFGFAVDIKRKHHPSIDIESRDRSRPRFSLRICDSISLRASSGTA